MNIHVSSHRSFWMVSLTALTVAAMVVVGSSCLSGLSAKADEPPKKKPNDQEPTKPKQDKSQDDWTMIDMITDGESMIGVFRPVAGGEKLNFRFDSPADARQLAESLLTARLKYYGEGHWQVTDARRMVDQLRSMEKLTKAQRGQLGEAVKLVARARKLLEQGKPGEALPLSKQACEIRSQLLGPDAPLAMVSLNDVAHCQRALKHHADAESLYQQSLAISKRSLGEKHPDHAYTLASLGGLYFEMGQHAKTEALLEQALAIRKESLGEKHSDYTNTLDKLADLSARLGQYDKAIRHYEQLLVIRKEVLGEKHADTVATLRNLASAYRNTRQYAKANQIAGQALDLDKQAYGENHPAFANSLVHTAKHYMEMSQYDKAAPLLRQALATYRQTVGTKQVDYLVALINLATTYRKMDQFAQAEPLAQQAVILAKEIVGEKHSYYVNALLNLASLYDRMDQPVKAERFYEQALEKCKETAGEKSEEYAAALCGVALHYMDLEQDIKAADLLLQSAALSKEALGEKAPNYLTCISSLASLYSKHGDYETAEPLYRALVRIRREVLGEKHPDYARSLHELASLFSQMEQYGRAAPLYRRALAIQKEALGENNLSYASTLYNFGALYYDMRQYAEAEPLLLQSKDIYKRLLGENNPRYATVLDGLAAHYLATGDYAKAAQASLDSLRITRRYMEQMADVQTEQQQLGYSLHSQLKLNRYLTIALAQKLTGEQVYPEVLSWKGMVWSRQLHSHRQAHALKDGSSEAARLAAQLAVARRNLAHSIHAPNMPTPEEDKRQKELGALSREIERLEKALSQASSTYRKQLEQWKPTVEKVRHCLPQDVVLIDFLEYWHHTSPEAKASGPDVPCLAAFVVQRDRPVERIELGPMAAITQAVNRWRQTFGAGRRGEESARDLRRLVWAPLESYLGGAKLVLVSPDEALGRLPFVALPGRAPGKYLLEERAIAIVAVSQLLPSLLQESKRDKSAPSLLLVGDVNFDRAMPTAQAQTLRVGPARFGPLPGSSAEIAAIQEVFRRRYGSGKVTVLRAEGANEGTVCRLASSHRYLHLATHGFFAEDSPSAIKVNTGGKGASGVERIGRSSVVGLHPGLLSGLALAGANQPIDQDNGLLTALEVADLDLTHVDLVTLSACGTGLGKSTRAEGLQGLQRAFQVAGARTVIASLWDVPDQSTRLLMQRCYDNLWRKQMPRLEALREAQVWMLREASHQPEIVRGLKRVLDHRDEQCVREGQPLSPYFWAAFVLSGDWK